MGLIPGFEGVSPDALASMLASLQGTLTPEGLLAQSQAENDRQAAALAAGTKAASEAAATAGQQYQQAAAAPPPQLDPLAQMLPTLAGNVAGALTGDKGYAERAHENLKGAQDDLMKARLDNLAALRDSYNTKALAAQRAGDSELEITSRAKAEQLQKTMQVILQKSQEDAAAARLKISEAGDTERARMNNETQIAVAKIYANARTGTSGSPDAVGGLKLEDYVDSHEMPDGSTKPYVDLTKIATPKARQQAYEAARSAGIAALNDREKSAITLIETVRGDMKKVTDDIIPLLPKEGGLKRWGSAAKNRVEAALQTPGKGEQLAAYPAIRTAAIKTIQALASLGKGLRINQAEINAAMNFDYPRITDSQNTATLKFQMLSMMADHIENAAMGSPPSTQEVRALLDIAKQIKESSAGTPDKTSGSDAEDLNAARRK